jgi:hypothetical protein
MIVHNIGLLVPIIIQPFLVLDVTEAFFMQELSCGLEADSLFHLLFDPWKEFNFDVLS